MAEPDDNVVLLRHAGFIRRFLAWCVDQCLIMVMQMILIFFGVMISTLRGSDGMAGLQLEWFLVLVLSVVFPWLYMAQSESSIKQASIGKSMLHLEVVNLQGRRVSFARATGRHFAKLISAFTCGFGYLMAAFTPKHQALHDMMAGCLVARSDLS